MAVLKSADKLAAVTEAFKELYNANNIKFTITQNRNGAIFRMTSLRCGTTQIFMGPKPPTYVVLNLIACKK